MKKKLILSFPSVKYQSKKPCIYADILKDKDTSYLICDYYADKAHKYRMAISADDYIHYDYEKERWDSKSSWNNDFYSQINRAEYACSVLEAIKKYARTYMDYEWKKASDIWCLEDKINEAADKRRKDRENNERELLFSKLKDITVGFKKSIDEHVARTDIIYYKRKGNYAEYHCCQCGEDYTRRIIPGETYEESLRPLEPVPKLYGIAECPNCHHRGSLLQAGHAKIEKDHFTAWMYKCADDGTLMIRAYGVSIQRSVYGAEDIRIKEYTRIFLDKGKARIYNQYGGEWYRVNNAGYSKDKIEFDYNSYSTILQSNLKYIPEGLEDLLFQGNGRRVCVDERIQALISYARCPQLETLYKIGLYQICKRIMWKEGSTKAIDKKANEAAAILRLCKEDYKYLIKNKHHNDDAMLEYIKRARIKGIPLKKYDMYIELCRNIHTADDIDYLLEFQNLEKLYNTINKYIPEYVSMAATLIEYRDYIRLRQRRGDDLTNTVYLRPRSLRDTYMGLRTEEERNKDKNYIEQMTVKYGNIANVSEKIRKRYTYETDEYLIRPAVDAAEIVMEGRMLHHCVGSDSQRYMRNYADNKSYILVCRKKSVPDAPYITIEIDGNVIRQWYGIHDSKPDEDIIKPLLAEYVGWLDRKAKKLKEAADVASQPVLMPVAI